MEKIRRNDPAWGDVLTYPSSPDICIEQANADLLVESLDERVVRLWKWEPLYRGMWVFLALLLCLSSLLIMEWPWVTYAQMIARGREVSSAKLLAFIGSAIIGIPLICLLALLLVPRPSSTRFCRVSRKVYGSSGLTGLGGWVELNFDSLTAVSVIERRYHQAGRTTTYSLWLCELDESDRIARRIVAMQPSRLADAPRQTWEFIRAYMHLPPDLVPQVKLARRGTRWADRVYAVNLRLFGMLVDDETHQLTGGFNRAFAVFLGAVMYPWEITAWLLEMILRERALPEALQRVLKQPAVSPNPYRTQEGRVVEEAKLQAVVRADGWLHALGAALSVVFYGWVIFLWMGAGAK